MKSQVCVAEAVRTESGAQGRLNQIKAEIAASAEQMSNAQNAMRAAKGDFMEAKKRLERARKDLGAFVEVHMDRIEVAL